MFSALTQVVPHLQQRRIARRSFSTMASAQKTWKLDASSEGCTGLFYRTRKADGSFATDKDPQWCVSARCASHDSLTHCRPRNGFVFKGTEVVPGWVQLAVRSLRRSSGAAQSFETCHVSSCLPACVLSFSPPRRTSPRSGCPFLATVTRTCTRRNRAGRDARRSSGRLKKRLDRAAAWHLNKPALDI